MFLGGLCITVYGVHLVPLLMILKGVDVNEISLFRHPNFVLFWMSFTRSYLYGIWTVVLHLYCYWWSQCISKWIIIRLIQILPRLCIYRDIVCQLLYRHGLFLSFENFSIFFQAALLRLNLILARSLIDTIILLRFLNFAFQCRDIVCSWLLFLDLHHLTFLCHQALNRCLLNLCKRFLVLHS